MKNIFMKLQAYIVPVFMAVCLVLIAANVYTFGKLEDANTKLGSLEEMNKSFQGKIESLAAENKKTKELIDLTNQSFEEFNDKLSKIDKSATNFNPKVSKLKEENEDAKKLLDTRLPDDLKRLLDEAINYNTN
jgi:DNA repair ATPase RecN